MEANRAIRRGKDVRRITAGNYTLPRSRLPDDVRGRFSLCLGVVAHEGRGGGSAVQEGTGADGETIQ